MSSSPKRIALKFFADSAAEVPLEPFIKLFHRFIQEQAVLGLLVDVADYAHVPHGPGVILIGHDVDYAVDSTAGRTGLLTTAKHYANDGAEIADVLEIPRNTVKTRLHKARQLLAVQLEARAESPALLESTTSNLEHWARGIREQAQA